MKSISEVNTFGAVDADSDALLFDCFEDHEAYDALLKRQKFLILGRKGAGKTAIFKMLLARREPSFFSFGHTFTDYPWEHHARQKRTGVPESETYLHSWTYLMLMSLAKIALNMDQSLPYKDDDLSRLSSLERFIIDSYGSRDPDLTEIYKPHQQLRLKPHLNVNFGVVSGGVASETVAMSDLPNFIPEVNKTVGDHLLSALNPAHEYHVAFDQLDLDFDPDSTDYKQRLVGLILAARRLNQKAKDLGKNLFISIFLRSDIYDVLQFEDKNKITENDSVRIEWDTSSTEHTLRELMERRFSLLIGEGSKVAWGEVFSGLEMTSRRKQYDYILDRTYSRPRDMIRFCNSILPAFRERKKASPGSDDVFVNDDILSAREDYSSYFLNEIDDELHKQLPQYKSYLELLKAIGFYQFEMDVFREVHGRRASDFGIRESALEVVRSLFEFSIVGFQKRGGRAGGSEWVFKYLDPRSRFDEEAPLLRVHYGLIEVLNLRRAQKTGPGEDSAGLDNESGGGS